MSFVSSSFHPGHYRRGSILRVTLSNFMSYSTHTHHFGAHLNLIIGPNAAGKSSIVCALCLGLGGSPALLNRADSVDKFIKKGKERAIIEIELAGDASDGGHLTVRRSIFKDKKCVYSLCRGDRAFRAASERQVGDAMKEMNIQVDNLCVFLAQDRVTSFSELRPKQLLFSTERAASPLLLDQHESLIDLTKRQKELQAKSGEGEGELERKRKQHQDMEAQIRVFEQKAALDRRLRRLQRYRPWLVYDSSKRKLREAEKKEKEKKAELQSHRDEYKPLYTISRSLTTDLANGRLALTNEEHALAKLEGRRAQLAKEIEELASEAEERRDRLGELKDDEKRIDRERAKLGELIDEQRTRVLAQGDTAAIDAQIAQAAQAHTNARRLLSREQVALASAEDAYRLADQQLGALTGQLGQLRNVAAQRLQHVLDHDRSGQHVRHREWIDRNRSLFAQPVFGPLASEVHVTDDLAAAFLESVVPENIKMAYVAQTKEDWAILSEKLPKHVTVIYVSNSHVERNRAGNIERAKRLGVEGFLSDCPSVTWPPAVLTALCEIANIHSIAYARHDLPADVIESLMKKSTNDRDGLIALITPSTSQRVQFGLYDKRDQRRNIIRTQQPRLFKGVDGENMREVEEKLAQAREAIDAADRERTECRERVRSAQLALDAATQAKKAIEAIKVDSARARESLEKLLAKQRDLDSRTVDSERRRLEGELAQRHQAALKKMRALHEIEIPWVAGSLAVERLKLSRGQVDLQAALVQRRVSEAEDSLAALQNEANEAMKERERLFKEAKACKGTAIQMAPREEFDDADSNEGDALPQQLAELDAQIIDCRTQLDAIVADNEIMKKFEQLTSDLAALEQRAASVRAQLQETLAGIQERVAQWKGDLTSLVGRIDRQFAGFYRDMDCEGSVTLRGQDDFEDYALEIKVSYRAGQAPRLLDVMAQSGGERSVATMLFLLSLQSVTRCPFRVVDEINQGMDSINERRVFDCLVKSATSPDSPQYFVVTPKLLPGLRYNEHITVHCVLTGPHLVNRQWTTIEQHNNNNTAHAQRHSNSNNNSSNGHSNSISVKRRSLESNVRASASKKSRESREVEIIDE